VVFDPTVPQSSTLCQPDPSATPELILAPERSERTTSVPVVSTQTRAIGPSVAVRSRRRSTALPPREVASTFTLMHAEGSVWASVR